MIINPIRVKVETALNTAAALFYQYERHHRAKSPPDDAKADINLHAAQKCHAALRALAAVVIEPNPNELPLELLHRNLKFSSMVYEEDVQLWFVTLCDDPDVRGCTPRYVIKDGPTPRAAFEAACAAAGERG